MKKILMLLPLLFLGCASLAVPRMQNMRSYEPTNCDPVLSVHIPLQVANISEIMDAIAKNPTLADKILPSASFMDSLGKNGVGIGLGTASIVSAIKDNLSMSAVISSAVLGGVSAFTEARSEDSTQSRVDVCMPKDATYIHFKNDDQEITIKKDSCSEENGTTTPVL